MQVNYGENTPTMRQNTPPDNRTRLHGLESPHVNQNHLSLSPTKVQYIGGPPGILLAEGVAGRWAKGVSRTLVRPNHLCLLSPFADTCRLSMKSKWRLCRVPGMDNCHNCHRMAIKVGAYFTVKTHNLSSSRVQFTYRFIFGMLV